MENTLLQEVLQEEVREGFKIDNLEGATWAFRKLRAKLKLKLQQMKKEQEQIYGNNKRLSNMKLIENILKVYLVLIMLKKEQRIKNLN